MSFTGFPVESIEFYEGLGADNSRAYWQANKAVFDTCVRRPMDELLAELDEFGPFHVFRPNRDLRFSKDKSPYKEQIGAFGEAEDGTGYYVHYSTGGMVAGAGCYYMATDQLIRFRTAIDDDRTGAALDAAVAAVRSAGLHIGAMESLKTAPRGYPRDHPRIDLLRRKGLVAMREWELAQWMQTNAVVGRVRDVWEQARPITAWLDEHVGPSTLPPADAGIS